MSVGEHTVTLFPDLGAGAGVDLSCLVDEVSIVHGRDDPTGQPEASAATVDFEVTPEEPLPAGVEIGAVIVVSTATPTGGSSTRFRGRVTDLTLGWDDAGEETPEAGIGQLIAVGPIADLARRVVGDAPFPQELDGARVSRVLTLAGLPPDPAHSDPGTVQILARDIDSTSALDVLSGTADSAGGLLWETRAGEVRYADAVHRRNTTVDLELDACDVLVTPSWQRNLEGLINSVSIGYGVAAAGGEQPRYVSSDPGSIARYGRFEYSLTTELAAAADATAMGQLLLVRNINPVWIMSALPVDLEGLDQAHTEAVLGLDLHSLVRLTGLPAIGTAPTTTVVWVEGLRERLAYAAHDLELVLSGYCRTAPAPRWNDVDPALTWDTVAASLTWDCAACFGPTINRGRWDDVAATLRWDQIPPAVTWDTWNSYVGA